MDPETVLWAVLSADSGVQALIAQDSLAPHVLPEGTPLPYCSLALVNENTFEELKRGNTRFVRASVQANVAAATWDQRVAAMKAVRDAGDTVLYPELDLAGVSGVTIHLGPRGPSFMNAEGTFHLGTQDFDVRYTETIG
jgi:hypothetical protein